MALDLSGNVASATSTGGITGKRGGRVRGGWNIIIDCQDSRIHNNHHCCNKNLQYNCLFLACFHYHCLFFLKVGDSPLAGSGGYADSRSSDLPRFLSILADLSDLPDFCWLLRLWCHWRWPWKRHHTWQNQSWKIITEKCKKQLKSCKKNYTINMTKKNCSQIRGSVDNRSWWEHHKSLLSSQGRPRYARESCKQGFSSV